MSRQSVERALDILSLFSISQPNFSIKEISEALNLSKSSVHGLVRTLLDRGFMVQDPETKKYSIGFSIYELGSVLSGTLKINQVAAGPVRNLVQESSMTARISIWDQATVLVTLTVYPNFQNFQFCPPGPRVPAYCTGHGKAVLAFLPKSELTSYLNQTSFFRYTPNTITSKEKLLKDLEKSRKRGHSIDCEEYMLGLACIGAPIFDGTGYPIGGMSLSGPPDQLLGEDLSRIYKGLILTARDISIYMGFSEDEMARRADFI